MLVFIGILVVLAIFGSHAAVQALGCVINLSVIVVLFVVIFSLLIK